MPRGRSISHVNSRFLPAALIVAALIYSPQLALAQFTQQGPKLVGTGASATAQQGHSVALSGDGNQAMVGGPGDFHSMGAAWSYRRSGGVWTQQGDKLVDTTASGSSAQGYAVALSANGPKRAQRLRGVWE